MFEAIPWNRRMFNCILRILSLMLILGAVGCGWNRPLRSSPGTLDQQRQRASVYDPYSDNDAGPEIVGGRPREFSKPRSEPTRSRARQESAGNGWWNNWLGGAQ